MVRQIVALARNDWLKDTHAAASCSLNELVAEFLVVFTQCSVVQDKVNYIVSILE